MRKPLTNTQLSVFCFMQEYFRKNDRLPPTAAVSAHLGDSASEKSARSNGSYHYNTLAAKGYLERNEAGGYRFKREAPSA
jgi:hypothetical protein